MRIDRFDENKMETVTFGRAGTDVYAGRLDEPGSAKLEGSALWTSPALTGALQPDPRTHRDRFTLTADIVVKAGAGKQATTGSTGE